MDIIIKTEWPHWLLLGLFSYFTMLKANVAAFRALIRVRCSLLFSTLAIKMKIQNMTERLACLPVYVPVSGMRAQI